MRIGFVGDVRGQVFHALAALLMLQELMGRPFDLVVQVGDMGAYPDATRMDAASLRYLEAEPSQGDFSRLLRADGDLARSLRLVRDQLGGPIHFIRGNHEDYTWLHDLPLGKDGTAVVDSFDLLRFVPDGTVLPAGALRIAFLGGEESGGIVEDGAIDADAYARLMRLGSGEVDLLVTHDAPYGLSTGSTARFRAQRSSPRSWSACNPGSTWRGTTTATDHGRMGARRSSA